MRDRVAAALETEGIINDVTAAILAVATFEFVIASQSSPVVVIEAFVARLAVGHVVGIAVGGGTALLLKRWHLSADNALQNARVVVLTAALLAYALGSMWLSEAGIAAAAIAGRRGDPVHTTGLLRGGRVQGRYYAVCALVVFIVLAAQLSLGDLRALGVGGLVVVIVVAALVRPLGVFLSTLGGRLTVRERMFVGGMGPRGIVPAASPRCLPSSCVPRTSSARRFSSDRRLVIFGRLSQGGLARHFAQALDILPMQTLRRSRSCRPGAGRR